MFTNKEDLKEIKDLKENVPLEWFEAGDVDFDELIYMKFSSEVIPAIQISPEVTNTYSNSTTRNIVEYILKLHSYSDVMIKDCELMFKIFGNKNFFSALKEFIKCWFAHSKSN